MQYLNRLKEATRYCEYKKKSGSKEMSIEDELILLKLIEGMHDIAYKHDILERLQLNEMNLEASIDFLQQLKLIDEFSNSKKEFGGL